MCYRICTQSRTLTKLEVKLITSACTGAVPSVAFVSPALMVTVVPTASTDKVLCCCWVIPPVPAIPILSPLFQFVTSVVVKVVAATAALAAKVVFLILLAPKHLNVP